MNKYKNEEGAVLLLLIIMMSAVVLILASLLRFNTQNIRFAAIEEEQEQALYLAEGVADSFDFYLLNALPAAYGSSKINEVSNEFVDNNQADSNTKRIGVKDFVITGGSVYLGQTTIETIPITIDYTGDADGNAPFNIEIDITVEGPNSSRSITAYYEIPAASTSGSVTIESYLKSKELNYSN